MDYTMMETQLSVKLPTFDGKAKNILVFWMHFKAYASVKGFLPALQDGGETNLPVNEASMLDPNDPHEALQIAAWKRNSLAVALMTMAFMTQTLMMYVNKACNDDWPGGLAHEVVKNLFTFFIEGASKSRM